jgi:hypothetical protein
MRDCCDARGRGEEADPGNLAQPLRDDVVLSEGGELSLDLDDPRFEAANLVNEDREHVPKTEGQGHVGIFEQCGKRPQNGVGAERQVDSLFAEEAADRIQPGSACGHPLIADAVEGEQFLLGGRLHWNGPDAATTKRVEERLGIRAIGLVAAHIGPHVLRGEQRDVVAEVLGGAPPVVCGPAGFQHDVCGWRGPEKPSELAPCESVPGDHVAVRIRDGDLEHVLC